METVDSGELIVDSGEVGPNWVSDGSILCTGDGAVEGQYFVRSEHVAERIAERRNEDVRKLRARVAELEEKLARIAREREDVIHPFWELCDELLAHFPERGPVEDPPPVSWPAEWPVWQAMSDLGNFVFDAHGDAYLYATSTGDVCNWSFADLGVGERVRPESRAAMSKCLADLRVLVPEVDRRRVPYAGAWERLQAVAERLYREVAP